MKRKSFRVWWPEELLSLKPTENLYLFGCFFDSAGSVDVVVSCAVLPRKILELFLSSDRQEALEHMNRNLPFRLHESPTFSIIGLCTVGERSMEAICDCNDKGCAFGDVHANGKPVGLYNGNQTHGLGSSREAIASGNCVAWTCGCEKVDDFIQSYKVASKNSRRWIQFQCKILETSIGNIVWLPELHHIHQNVEKPKWVKELYKKPSSLNLVLVLLALNCSSYFKTFFKQSESNRNISRFVSPIWHLVAVFVATVSTAVYILLQFFNMILCYGPRTFFSFMSRMFPYTWKNVHIRSCQFLYWPIFLKGTGFRVRPNIEYAHKSACKKHFMWSNIVMDVILGIAFSVVLLANIEDVCYYVSATARDITDNLLRSGCVWLMGVPAGFKLNNELAELLGMISLHAIQIISALWFFLSNLLRFFIKLIAVSGIVFGLTVPFALSIDLLKIVTFHVLTLHRLISFLYSQQIQALASLWRIFRGQKLNPLRQRLDSYDYTVEQHVLGSLLFTPLLLLLPTTSVFYIFFSSLSTTISFVCILFEITISILHATPYNEILLRIVRRRRFPCGVWFRILYPKCKISDGTSSHINVDDRGRHCFMRGGSEISVSILCSNYATFGEVITPHYRNIFDGVDPSFGMSLAHGILSGQRFPSALNTRLPPTMVWFRISCMEYWKLCYSVVLSSRL